MKKIFLLIITSFCLGIVSGCDAKTATTAPNIPGSGSINPSETVVLKGVVEDQSSKPVSEAIIVVKDDSKVIAKTKTNPKGEFSVTVPKVFGDSYFVVATKNSPEGTMEQTLLVTTGQEANFTGNDRLRRNDVPAKPVPAS